MEDLTITNGLIAQIHEDAKEVFTFDLLEHDDELKGASVIQLFRLWFAWANYYHWCSGGSIRGQANMIEGWMVDRLWENDSNDWFEIKAFILDTAEYLNDEFNFFDLTGDQISKDTEFRRRQFLGSYQRLGEYIRSALAELAPEDAYLLNVVNTLAQFWVEWYATNANDLNGDEGTLVRITDCYDAIQGNLRELTLGNSEAAMDETYALKA